jgi:hypothetical protein
MDFRVCQQKSTSRLSALFVNLITNPERDSGHQQRISPMKITITCSNEIGMALAATFDSMRAIAGDSLKPEDFKVEMDLGTPRKASTGKGRELGARVHYMTVALPAKAKALAEVQTQIRELPPMSAKIYHEVSKRQAIGEQVTKRKMQEFFGTAAPTMERELGRLVAQGLLQSVPIVHGEAEAAE